MSFSSVNCCADDKCNDEVKTEQTNNHSTNHQSTTCNTCSPFFTCGSCSGFVFSSLKLDFDKSFVIKDTSPTLYKSHFPDNVSAEIWQPPKIS